MHLYRSIASQEGAVVAGGLRGRLARAAMNISATVVAELGWLAALVECAPYILLAVFAYVLGRWQDREDPRAAAGVRGSLGRGSVESERAQRNWARVLRKLRRLRRWRRQWHVLGTWLAGFRGLK